MRRLLAIGLAAGVALATGAARAAAGPGAPDAKLVAAEAALGDLETRARELEGLAGGTGPTADRRFEEAEGRFLSGDFAAAAALLSDLIEDPRVRASGRLADVRYYLAESLYRQGNDRDSRERFRELIVAREGRHLEQGIERYLELCDRLDDFSGADEVMAAAGQATTYVLAKWTYRRTDLPRDERLRRAEAAFGFLARGPAAARARYFLGVIAVERGQLDAAAGHFAAAAKAAGKAERDLVDLANLAQARVYHEQEKWAPALDRYRAIDSGSKFFDRALFEIAWTYGRMRSYEKALRLAETLSVMAERTPMAAEARLLRAHLLVEAGRYDEARAVFGAMATDYGSVRDEIDAMLRRYSDPVAYFDRVVASRERAFGAGDLLPASAVRFGEVRAEVERVLEVTRDLAESRQGLVEARALATRLLADLGRGADIELSPELALARARVRAAVAAADALKTDLERLRTAARGPERVTSVDRLRVRLDAVSARLVATRDRLKLLADREIAVLRDEVAAEAARLESLDAEAGSAGDEAKALGGRLAVRAIETARQRFDDLSVRADAGVADVAWRKKRARSDEIRRLAEERDDDLRELEHALKEFDEARP